MIYLLFPIFLRCTLLLFRLWLISFLALFVVTAWSGEKKRILLGYSVKELISSSVLSVRRKGKEQIRQRRAGAQAQAPIYSARPMGAGKCNPFQSDTVQFSTAQSIPVVGHFQTLLQDCRH